MRRDVARRLDQAAHPRCYRNPPSTGRMFYRLLLTMCVVFAVALVLHQVWWLVLIFAVVAGVSTVVHPICLLLDVQHRDRRKRLY